jgi:capsular polysaccharide transport system permease protein
MLDKLPQARSARRLPFLPEPPPAPAPAEVANYEELVVDREFAEKAYVSALSSLERARVEADRQQRYVAAFVRPTLPGEALYPRRIVASITVFAIALVLWALGVLIGYAIRDQAL